MATWDASRLMTRMREVLEDARGTLRTITAGLLEGNLPPGLTDNEEARRALPTITGGGFGGPTEARITGVRRSPASPPVIGNLALYEVDVEVRHVLPFTSLAKLSDSMRDSLMGIAAAMADVIAQAFTFPGNLSTTQSGDSTGLVSGMFAYVGTAYEWKGTVNADGGTLESRHRFKGVVRSAPAVS